MTRRKLLTLLATAGLCTAGLGAAQPASAELRALTVTLATGQTVQVTVDVLPGTPADQIEIPGMPAPVVAVQDHGPLIIPSPTATPEATSTPAAKPEREAPDDAKASPRTRQRGNRQSSSGVVREAEKAPAATPAPTATAAPSPAPAPDDPGFTQAMPGAAPIGVPNFFIDKFRIPPFLLPIYQAAGTQYGVRWEVLAAINEIETDYGRNLNVSSAGARGWMQFMPATWRSYGVDANQDGVKDPYNPVDAIFASARYLRAAGAERDLAKAVFAYNHADWYVDSVLLRARVIGGLPANLVSSLTGLTQGRFPVYAKATYADDLSRRDLARGGKRGSNPGYIVESSGDRRGIDIFARRGAPVIAVGDGRVVSIGETERLGRFVRLRDVYGNTFTYARLGKVAERYPAPKPRRATPAQIARELELPAADPKPTRAATAGRPTASRRARPAPRTRAAASPKPALPKKERLFANPTRPNAEQAGGAQQLAERGAPVSGLATAAPGIFGLDRKDIALKDLEVGSRVAAGTILGRIGASPTAGKDPHVFFEIRPAGRGAPRIDPKPILDGWKLLESTALYRAEGRNPFFGRDAAAPSIGQILLMSSEALAERVAGNPRIALYECGRRDVRTGQIDRRVLATLEFLAASGLKPTVTSLRCGHGYLTASGNVSEHSSGNAVDIAAINGIPIAGNQGAGSITETAISRLLTLQGTMKPHQIISLMKVDGADNTFAMRDHADHIHVGWKPLYGSSAAIRKQVDAALEPEQWIKLIDRLGRLDNPTIPSKPSKAAVKRKRTSGARRDDASGGIVALWEPLPGAAARRDGARRDGARRDGARREGARRDAAAGDSSSLWEPLPGG